MIHVAICDKKIELKKKIEEILVKLYGNGVRVFVCESIFALENHVIDTMKGNVDILFVNLAMPEGDVVATVASMQADYPDIQVTFMAEGKRQIGDIFRANPAYFLLKPVAEQHIQEAMNRMLVRLRRERKELWAFEGQKGLLVIPKEEILYVESNRREITIVLTGNRREKGIGKMGDMEEGLGDEFIRCHQSYIVNASKIWCINSKEITLYNEETVPVSRPRYKATRAAVLKYIGRVEIV